jgi:hypothetical protein
MLKRGGLRYDYVFRQNNARFGELTMLRLAWICGLLSTREYHVKSRLEKYGSNAIVGPDSVLDRLDRSLVQDRIAVVLFLVGLVILTYAALKGPALS